MSEENKIDFIPIVRAMVKLSSALTEADTVANSRYYKFKFKKVLDKWIDKTEKATKPFMGKFLENSEEALQAAYDGFIEHSKDVKIKDEEKTALVILYCKAKSSMNDMEKLSFEEGGMITHILIKYTSDLLKWIEKQYGDIFTIKDSEGNHIQSLIDDYDNLGEKMFTKNK